MARLAEASYFADGLREEMANGTPNGTAVMDTAQVAYYREAVQAYAIAVPLMVGCCVAGAVANGAVLWLGLAKARRRTLTLRLTVSLAGNDLLMLVQLALGLLVNSYLPFVKGVVFPRSFNCFLYLPEALRLGGITTSVLHILALTLSHLAAIATPGAFRNGNSQFPTSRLDTALIALLWSGPPCLFLVVFAANAEQTFLSPTCSGDFVLSAPFRALVFALVLLPLLGIVLAYAAIVWRLNDLRHRLRSSGRLPAQRKDTGCYRRGCRMAQTMGLIIGTFLLGWLPCTLWYALTGSDGPLPIRQLMRERPTLVYSVGIAVNALLILKGLLNPAIYASRVPELRALVSGRQGDMTPSRLSFEQRRPLKSK